MVEPKKPPARKPRKPARQPGQPKRGPLPWEPSAQERLSVEVGVANGYSRQEIADALEKSVDSLERHCAKELKCGDIKAGMKISGALMQKAMKGDVGAIVWWEKTRRGMKDQSRTEHTGKDGGPIEYADLSEEELDARIAAMIAGDGPGITQH